MVVCVGGRFDGFWYFREDWDARVRAHGRMRELGSSSGGGLDYRASGRKLPHPTIAGGWGDEVVPVQD